MNLLTFIFCRGEILLLNICASERSFQIQNRVKVILGIGYQTAQGTGGSFDNPLFGHAWLGTTRVTF